MMTLNLKEVNRLDRDIDSAKFEYRKCRVFFASAVLVFLIGVALIISAIIFQWNYIAVGWIIIGLCIFTVYVAFVLVTCFYSGHQTCLWKQTEYDLKDAEAAYRDYMIEHANDY